MMVIARVSASPGSRLVHHGADRPAVGCGDAEALDVDALLGHAGREQRGLGLVVHLERAADEGMVDVARPAPALREELADLVAVHHAAVERRVGVLVARTRGAATSRVM